MGEVALSEVTTNKSMTKETMLKGKEKKASSLLKTPFTQHPSNSQRSSNQPVNKRHNDHVDRRDEGGSDDAQRILFVTTEITDFVKVGGLGDVSSALPRALAAHHDVRVLIPAYRSILESEYDIVTVI